MINPTVVRMMAPLFFLKNGAFIVTMINSEKIMNPSVVTMMPPLFLENGAFIVTMLKSETNDQSLRGYDDGSTFFEKWSLYRNHDQI